MGVGGEKAEKAPHCMGTHKDFPDRTRVALEKGQLLTNKTLGNLKGFIPQSKLLSG